MFRVFRRQIFLVFKALAIFRPLSNEIDIETGFEKKLITLAGGLTAFGHYVELETLGLKFDTMVYFAADYALQRNLLGRQGWLGLIKIGLDDYRSEIYINPNDEEL